jgi:hypothetical protein
MNTFSFKKAACCCFVLLIVMKSPSIYAQDVKADPIGEVKIEQKVDKKWYDIISIRGYAQIRYNRLLETNENLKCEQCDRSIGKNNGISVRRARLVFSGHVTPTVYFYIQPDLAVNASATSQNFLQIRDLYVDLGLDNKNEYRFRIGQSKVPFGFDNMQSSQNRLNLDRSDAINSGAPNERDMGVFFYYAPDAKRKMLAQLVKDGSKGTGDYGIFALGVYNGQSTNKPEQNNSLHIVSRVTYPFNLGSQIIEPGIQAFTGKWTMASDQLSPSVKLSNVDKTFNDKRFAATLVLYPKPFGIQAEYNVGTSPQFNPATATIEQKKLKGGYIVFSYMTSILDGQKFTPFLRFQSYKGGKKLELDARSYDIKDLEFGAEWQLSKGFEFTAAYCISNRRFEDFGLQNNLQKGNFLRLQTQVNF